MGMQYKPGRYFGRINNQGFGKTKNGDDQFWLTFDLIGAINPADPEGNLLPCDPGERTAYFTLKTDKNAEFFVKDMKRLGCPMTSFGMLDPGNSGFHDFAGKETEFECEENNWQGKQNERWKLGGSSGGPVAVQLDAKEVRRMDALFGAALKGDGGQKKPAGRTVAPPANPPAAKANGNGDPNRELMDAAATHRGEDIPF